MIETIETFLLSHVALSKALKVGLKILTIIIVAAIINKLLTNFVLRYLEKKGTKQSLTLKGIASTVIKYLMYFFVVTAVLDIFGISFSSIIAVAGIGSVAIGFGAQSLVKDVITGAFILFEDQFAVGDFVELEGRVGTVEKVGLRTTLIRNALNNEQYIIPNSQISIVTNKTKEFQRAAVNFEVPYEVKLTEAIKVLEDALKANIYGDKRLLGEPNIISATAFNESGVGIRITCDTINGEVWAVERDIRKIVKIALDEAGIEIPYKTQTIHIAK